MFENDLRDGFVRQASLEKVVDGDTLRLKIDLGWGMHLIHDVRLFGVDTPEPRGPEAPAGKWVTRQVQQWFGIHTDNLTIKSEVFRLGKYGRCLCDVWRKGVCLNHWLLDSRLAWPTNKQGEIVGVRDIGRLYVPDGIQQQVREALV